MTKLKPLPGQKNEEGPDNSEDFLFHNDELYRILLETSPDGIFISDLDGNILKSNKKAREIIGFEKGTRPDGAVHTIFDYLVPADKKRAERNFDARIRGRKSDSMQYCSFKKDDTVMDVEIHTSLIPPKDNIPGLIIGIFRDITKQRRYEKNIREANEKLTRAQQTAHIGSWEFDLTTGLSSCTNEMYRIFGLPLQSPATPEFFWKNFHPEEREMHLKAMEDAISKDIPYSYDFRIVRPSGEERFIHSEGSVLRDKKGKAILVYGTTQDITESKISERATRESEELYRKLISASPDTIALTDLTGRITLISENAFKMLNVHSEKEIIGTSIFDWVSAQDLKKAKNNFLKIRETGRNFDTEYSVRIKARYRLFSEINASLVKAADGSDRAVILIIRDITERKKTEEKIRKYTQQLRALTSHHEYVREKERLSLAREMHDVLGASLSGIKMHLQVLLKSLANYYDQNPDISEQINHLMEMTNETVISMRKIVRGLRPGILEELGFVEAIRWYINDLQMKVDIHFIIKVIPEDISVEHDKEIVLFRIFLELITNIISHAKATRVTILIKKENQRFLLKVKDNGIGINKHDLEKRTSFGILGIKERVIILKGKVDFKGSPTAGTMVKIDLPMR